MQRDIDFFLKEKFNSGMLIVGDWGTGKTYTINEMVKNTLSSNTEYKFISHVSINGINNIDKIEEYIYSNKEPVGNGIISTIRRNRILNIEKIIDKKFEKYDLLARKNTIDTIIIIDDIERAISITHPSDVDSEKSSNNFILNLFGLLNRITQGNNSKFIGVMNANLNQEDVKSISSISEKVFSKIINFKQRKKPIDIAVRMLEKTFNKTFSLEDDVYKVNEHIQCTNIRVLYKTLLSYMKINGVMETSDIENNITNKIINQIKSYYLFLCYLYSLGEFDLHLHNQSSIDFILNNIDSKLKKNSKGHAGLGNIFNVIFNSEIYSYRYLITEVLLELMCSHENDHAKLKSKINNKISEIHSKISDIKISDLLSDLKTNIKQADEDFSCITENSNISIYDAMSLLFLITDEEIINIIIKNLNSMLTDESKGEIKTIITLIDSLFLCNKNKEIHSSCKLESIKSIYDIAKQKLINIEEIENKEKEEKNKKPYSVDQVIHMYDFMLYLMIGNNEKIEVVYFSEDIITMRLTQSNKDSHYNHLNKLMEYISHCDVETNINYFENQTRLLFELIYHINKRPLEFNFISNDEFKGENKKVIDKINNLFEKLQEHITNVKDEIFSQNPYLKKAMHLYLTDRYINS